MKFDSNKLEIKTLDQSHLEDIIKIQNHEKDNPHFQSESKQGFSEHFKGRGFLLGAFIEGKLVAYSKFWFPGHESVMGEEIGLKEIELPSLAYFNGTVVLKEYRGHNIQKLIHQKAEQILKYQGFSYISCTVHPDNQASLTNLDQEGFKIFHEKKAHGDKRLVLFKKIS